ncbi:MAG: DUF421 domain-containing protein [Microlunatus sp.]|nr:DUF421 domain-containing protein [Microlunatus sp.]MDN5803162.1 DUF421 domain-containing protein [Microlunatus sp.]
MTISWLGAVAVVAKAVLMYATALIGLRLGQRRTVAQFTIIDFVAAVSVGAIVARTAVAQDQSWEAGVIALVAILAAHQLVSKLRFQPLFTHLTDHRVRILVANGQLQRRELSRTGVTETDLFAELRLRGVFDLAAVHFVLYETKGGLTVVSGDDPADAPLVLAGLAEARALPAPLPDSSRRPRRDR